MRRRAEVMRGPYFVCCGLLLLAGCATAPVPREPLSAPEQEALLRGLAGFQLEGRAFVQVGNDGSNATLSWHQRADESQLRLSGPLGAGSLLLVYSPQALRVTTSHGEVLRDDEAEQALSAQLGFIPPFEALRYWVLGLTAPGETPVEQATDSTGRIADMTQQQWRIHYDRWADVATRAGMARLPQRLTATRADLRLRLFVDRWKLQAAD